MDALSRLLSLYPLSTTLDVRCLFGAPWVLDHSAVASGIAPYHLVVSGEAWLDAAGQTGIALLAGDIIVFPKGSAHRLYTGGEGEATPLRDLPDGRAIASVVNDGSGALTDILCGQFEFDAGSSNALLQALPEILLVRSSGRPDFAGLQALVAMLRQETDIQRPGASAVVAQLSSALFALVLRAWLEQAEAVPGLFALLADRRLQAALQDMLAAPEKPWTLQDMAAACHMSRATFARVFHRVAGITPAAMLMQMRMAQAALWLAQGKRAVGDIGEAVGYQSEAAFNRVFKRCFGVGPGQYRRSARAGNT
ncbi:AraC family transcriptional activator of mtrCDE [Collimonas sp. PA-H2]|uniref:AraC family transcriptional regulator n=1 Tax=Collimonas sp. PA-H2 TaxID=1881062 RepID=UPI000BF457AF|nr:AraC family transcriptional regulator [Collimonas sp. PA-H2]PFH04557.1 AraC family transcriptional activator of mtrCDE [Collimonas sp. PA-H2]